MFSLDEIKVTNPEPQTEAGVYAAEIQNAIGALESKLTYPPSIRMGILGGVLGGYFGGAFGALAGTATGYALGRRRIIDPVERQVIQAQIEQLRQELHTVAQSGELNEGEMAGIMNSGDLMNYKYDCYAFDGPWGELMGNPGKRFHLMVFGRPKQGKSIFSVKFANYLSQKFGPVLYVASEEGFSATLQKKIADFGMANRNMDFANFREYEQIKSALENKKYKFVFIDSVNFIKVTPDQIEELKAANPGTAFVTIQQATKGGQFRGSQEYAHNCDMICEVINGVAHHTGRYNGHTEMAIFEEPKPPAEQQMPGGGETSPEQAQMELF